MRQFKYKDKLFGMFFTNYHKEYDSYKDSNQKGLLERFVEVCGEYLDEEVNPLIDNHLKILDFDNCPEEVLVYWWEYFGSIPYAYQVLNQSSEVIEPYPNANTRDVLKYAMSLYKIRCTDRFYQVLGKFYNVVFEFIPLNFSELSEPYSKYDKTKVKFDSSYSFDKNNCLECLKLKVIIHLPQGVFEYFENTNEWDKLKKSFLLILNKYMPPHVELITQDDIEFSSTTAIINL